MTTPSTDDDDAARYPDVEHPGPPEIPASAFAVPPPFSQRTSDLLDLVHQYRDGEATWEQTLDSLATFAYEPVPDVPGDPTGPDPGQWWGDVEAERLGPAPDNTFYQLQEANDFGLLTDDEFRQVHEAFMRHHKVAPDSGGLPEGASEGT